jgi:hypothetical protein
VAKYKTNLRLATRRIRGTSKPHHQLSATRRRALCPWLTHRSLLEHLEQRKLLAPVAGTHPGDFVWYDSGHITDPAAPASLLIGQIAGIYSIDDVAAGPNGSIYFSGQATPDVPDSVYELISPDNYKLVATTPAVPARLAVDSKGDVFVAYNVPGNSFEFSGQTYYESDVSITEISGATGAVTTTTLSNLHSYDTPFAIVVGNDGTVYIGGFVETVTGSGQYKYTSGLFEAAGGTMSLVAKTGNDVISGIICGAINFGLFRGICG